LTGRRTNVVTTSEHADAWDLYAGHRARFTDALIESSKPGDRVCILGAGPCNDIDLERMAGRFSEIHLVDIDKAALTGAVRRQSMPVRDRLRVHAPVDLSGFESRLKHWKRVTPTPREIDAMGMGSSTLRSFAVLEGPFDLVVSACVLTQMSFRLLEAFGESHPLLGRARVSLMRTHLATLLGLTARGGTSLFVSDLTSSTSFPLETRAEGRTMFDVMGDIVEQGAFYHAANPNLIEDLVESDPDLRTMTGSPELLEPWLWTGAFDRTYFVYALRFRRSI
jgi:hypothetical protein